MSNQITDGPKEYSPLAARYGKLTEEIVALEKENARYRSALASVKSIGLAAFDHQAKQRAIKIANDALSGIESPSQTRDQAIILILTEAMSQITAIDRQAKLAAIKIARDALSRADAAGKGEK